VEEFGVVFEGFVFVGVASCMSIVLYQVLLPLPFRLILKIEIKARSRNSTRSTIQYLILLISQFIRYQLLDHQSLILNQRLILVLEDVLEPVEILCLPSILTDEIQERLKNGIVGLYGLAKLLVVLVDS
jgi:hypothetical protein